MLTAGQALAEPAPPEPPSAEIEASLEFDSPSTTPSSTQAQFSPGSSPQPPASPQGQQPPAASEKPGSIPAGAQEAVVSRHVDGDTIWAEGGTLPPGATNRIRLLQIDTPESTNQTSCYGPEASAFTKAELPVGSKIYLLADKEDKDRYGRFLRYIWKPNGEFFNEKLARQGYAKAVLYMPNDRYISLVRAAEAEAKAAQRGLWAACAAASPPAPQPVPPALAPQPAGGGCDPHYPDVCIAPYPPDLNCGDIPHRRFRVLQPDPHGFDGDQDGVGCESG